MRVVSNEQQFLRTRQQVQQFFKCVYMYTGRLRLSVDRVYRAL